MNKYMVEEYLKYHCKEITLKRLASKFDCDEKELQEILDELRLKDNKIVLMVANPKMGGKYRYNRYVHKIHTPLAEELD